MVKKIFIFIFLGLGLWNSSLGWAQPALDTPERNPFEPQLPRADKKPNSLPEKLKPSSVKQPPVVLKPAPSVSSAKPAEAPKMPQLLITGLVWNSDRPQAIVNGQVVDVGDKIETVQIVAINQQGLEVNFMGNRVPIKM
ncbi:MAG: hypothetical protein HQL23_01755 [Candidatus Omnitrophica bacterium]|nr:hypothetical protein [Candidatus Omnitrophota bacterium]